MQSSGTGTFQHRRTQRTGGSAVGSSQQRKGGHGGETGEDGDFLSVPCSPLLSLLQVITKSLSLQPDGSAEPWLYLGQMETGPKAVEAFSKGIGLLNRDRAALVKRADAKVCVGVCVCVCVCGVFVVCVCVCFFFIPSPFPVFTHFRPTLTAGSHQRAGVANRVCVLQHG